MTQDFLDIGGQVLDRQVVDSNHYPCGKVDDIEVEGGTKLRITAILIGNGAAADRLPTLPRYISKKLFGDDIVRIPWSEVEVITNEIKLRSRAKDLDLDERQGPVYKLIRKIPRSWEK